MFVGPRVTGAGHYLSITGGGGDVNFLGPEHQVRADGLVVDGVEAIRKAVREEVKFGSDWIKVLASGAFMSSGDDPRRAHFSPEELRALVEEANRLGVPVMAHAHAAEGIKQAVVAGVRSIEHGSFIDKEGIELMKRQGVFLVPTQLVFVHAQEEDSESEALKKMVELGRKYLQERSESISQAIQSGVKVVVGTDNVGFPPAKGAREFELLHELGMSPMDAIMAGTSVSAEMLGWEDRIGTLETGKLADMIAVEGDPLQDLSELQRVSFVMLGGKIVRSLPEE